MNMTVDEWVALTAVQRCAAIFGLSAEAKRAIPKQYVEFDGYLESAIVNIECCDELHDNCADISDMEAVEVALIDIFAQETLAADLLDHAHQSAMNIFNSRTIHLVLPTDIDAFVKYVAGRIAEGDSGDDDDEDDDDVGDRGEEG